MNFINNLFIFLLILEFRICNACEINLADYTRTKDSPTTYTLALLDKSMVANIVADESIPKELRPFIHPAIKLTSTHRLEAKTFPKKDNYPQHFVVELKHRKGVFRSALLTEALLQEEEEKPKDDSGQHVKLDSEDDSDQSEDGSYESKDSSGEAEQDGEDENEDLEYAASMILYPVTEGSDEVLAYLLGNWTSLLNTTAIISSFGLKITVSIGVASTFDCRYEELSNIKEIVTETRRQAKPMRGIGKQQKGLGKVTDFGIDAASDGLEKVRLNPARNWGKALLDGDDFFKFRLPTKVTKSTKKGNKPIVVKPFNDRYAMYDVAKEVYRVYSTGTIHKDFLPYLDDPVTGDIVGVLNKELQEKWQDYFSKDKILYMHWTFWFRARGQEDVGETLKKIKEGGALQDIEIGGQKYKPTQLVRSLPIPLCLKFAKKSDYYWFDRGRWYRIPETRFQVIQKRIADVTVEQKDLFLPDYEIDGEEDDYKELAYNKAAVEAMNSQKGGKKPVSEVILLDRENVSLGGRDDKFEFADILMQDSNGKYFLIHVKRERSRAIDHHRTQAERCALFLGENLDRGVLPGLLMKDIVQDFYRNYITLPKKKPDPKEKKDKDAEQGRCSDFRTKFFSKRKEIKTEEEQVSKKKKGGQFFDFVKDDILNVRSEDRKFLKKIITSSTLKPLIMRFESYGDALFRCFDALEDFILYGSVKKVTDAEKKNVLISPDRIDFVKGFLEKVLTLLDKHSSLTKHHQGALPQKDRENITIVLAIIGDGSGKDDFHRQQLWGMDQTRKLIEKQGFKFQVVFIKDKTKKIEEKDKDDDLSDDLAKDAAGSDSPGSTSLVLPASPPIIDPILEAAKKKAVEVYGKKPGYLDILDDIMVTEDGRKYLHLKVDGSQGDCCFHALGLKRETVIKQMGNYIDESEGALLKEGIRAQVEHGLSLRNLCNPIMTTANTKDLSAFQGHGLSGWKKTVLEGIDGDLSKDESEEVGSAFDAVIEQQPAATPDWDTVLKNTQRIRDLVYKATAGVEQLINYKEFVEKCRADLWKRVGDNTLLARIEQHFKKVGVLDDKGDLLRAPTDSDLDFEALKKTIVTKREALGKKKPRKPDLKQKKEQDLAQLQDQVKRLTFLEAISTKHITYIKYQFEFSTATAQRKKEILESFYLANHEWLDPSAIMHLGPHFGFKAKLFKRENSSGSLRIDAKTSDADVIDAAPCRLIVYVNDNHYDLLYPINEG